jgi:hypothetical protein
MSRIATGLLIVGAMLAFNGGLLRDAMAEDQVVRVKLEAAAKGDTCATEPRGSRVMSLLLCLEALRQAPAPVASPKV